MTYLDKLLQGVEVEWKTLDTVFDIIAGGDVPKEAFSDIETDEFNIPILSNGIDSKSLYGWTTIPKIGKPSITISARGTIGWTSYRDKPFFPIVRLLVLTPKVNVDTKFAYYYMKAIEDQYNVPKNGIPQLTKPMVKDILFPIPYPNNPKNSLSAQKEIVHILDTFTELIEELTAELTARKNQYEYYRDQLLTFKEEHVEWKSLKELTTLITKGTTPKNYTANGIAFIKTEAFDGTYINPNKLSFIDEETHNKELKRSILKHNDILITIAGATIGKCAIVPKEILPANTNQALAIIRLNPNVNLKFVFHLIKSNYLTKYIEQNIKGSAQPNLNLEQLNNFTIPYPSPEEQARIVSILDKFDTLTTSISEGLPKEIELRKKQYEYYRDQLLNFPKNNQL